MRFQCDEEVGEVVHRFERCNFSLAEFDHRQHLTVGMAYLWSAPTFEAAMTRMRESLRRFSAHHGKMGYHETITRFWLLRLQEVRCAHPGDEVFESCNRALKELQDKELIFRHYPKELLMSDEARARWVSPARPSSREVSC